MNEELKPIENNVNDFNKELEVKQEEKKEVPETDKFASNFPEWDLLPTNQVVRRVTRK